MTWLVIDGYEDEPAAFGVPPYIGFHVRYVCGVLSSRSIDYESRYTELTYGYEDDKVDYLSLSSSDEETVQEVRWVSFRQHFFSAILIPEETVDRLIVTSENLSSDESLDEVFTKKFSLRLPLAYKSGEFESNFEYYFGITDYQTLKSYDRDLESSIPVGWGIFGWLNRFVFMPLFGFLCSFLPHGLAIILMTIIVRLAMSPVTYKSYVCLLYTSPSPRDLSTSRMPSSA